MQKNVTYGYILFSSCVIFLSLSIYYESRAFLFANLISFFFLFFFIYKQGKITLISKISVIFLSIAILLPLAMVFKTDSSLGRLLIYKVSFFMFADSWFTGIGQNGFSSNYLLYQADYFKRGSFSTKELLLADNSYHVYNDYWQFIIEYGVFGLIILILAVGLLARMIVVCMKRYNNNPPLLLSFSIVHLLTLCIAAFFTYVFERPTFKCLGVSFILVIFSYTFLLNGSLRWKIMLLFALILNLAIIVSSNLSLFRFYTSYSKWKEALNLSHAGYSLESLELLEAIYPQMKGDDEYICFYGLELLAQDNFKKALPVLLNAAKQKPANWLYEKLGDCYANLRQNKKAEEAYRLAVFMVPNRFGTRLNLFKFYLKTDQKQRAAETAEQLLKLPIKIPSPTVNKIKAEVRQMLHTF